jgi:hypothetical protein
LSEEEGELHPTLGGLRIGKTLPEREENEPVDSQLEWDRDGQYFHYLTKWMHALICMGRQAGERRHQCWAAELAETAHRGFVREMRPGGPKRILWKMSVDLTRPLVSSMGQLDPLDGLITCLELQTAEGFTANQGTDLRAAIADMTQICVVAHWATDDPLGIGGLLDAATRLSQLVVKRGLKYDELLHRLLVEASFSLQSFSRSFRPGRSAERRLAFRELGLSIGIHGLQRLRHLVANDRELAGISDSLLPYQPLATQISSFWSNPAHRLCSTWMDHCDINSVMLATSLAPEGYLQL